jgi:hypothetical protein
VALRRVELGGRECILAVVRNIDERRRAQDERRQAEKLQALGELAGGAVGFLEKPYRITEASRLLRQALRQEINA